MVGKSGINRIMNYTEVIPKADDDNQIYMKYKYKLNQLKKHNS
jgi:hypothetical protein